ncbi:hypothetical protein PanWU01x14_349100 [Parasponia andersonii]|uniref:Uncharacterized protein n=1 Tax=Parasponia andersonii TaxID=3476 RepID=A0A2P5ABH9_PARAD|nr:hypothetical protein PanWU01x14_349100 [Parasponia andersonii]
MKKLASCFYEVIQLIPSGSMSHTISFIPKTSYYDSESSAKTQTKIFRDGNYCISTKPETKNVVPSMLERTGTGTEYGLQLLYDGIEDPPKEHFDLGKDVELPKTLPPTTNQIRVLSKIPHASYSWPLYNPIAP